MVVVGLGGKDSLGVIELLQKSATDSSTSTNEILKSLNLGYYRGFTTRRVRKDVGGLCPRASSFPWVSSEIRRTCFSSPKF